ncbi:hypothetical protein M501DRAFT_944233 [Patellaria atrata CBS 101060]|uniref:RRM domain-containing protein n=1 Tax=Patellaria atrata CBS 101060 TaxID=1346257 RepID=A0A9P4S1I0_9PEZI|nr:hypothetical protein M501DRAFT_944233 [Patellaria atrata CBS 101060]
MNKGPGVGHNQFAATHAQALRSNSTYLPSGSAVMSGNYADTGLSALATGFTGMNLHSNSSAYSINSPSAVSSDYSAVQLNAAQAMYLPHQHQVMYTQGPVLQGSNQTHHGIPQSPSLYTSMSHFLPQGYAGYHQHLGEHSPLSQQSWTPRTAANDLPTLITPRRDSISSAENDLPGTPYYSSYHNAVTVLDRSPAALYPHSATPSPSQGGPGYAFNAYGKPAPVSVLSPELQRLIQQDPPIPRAIPAPSSPMKPLDRSLENKNGETNVYIRGLLPETTDEMLHSWGIRFGPITSSKSIIDSKTNSCKGFGFIKFHGFEAAENCIRGFHHLGYEVSFARESFYAKLKKFSDDGNTNLYISNIPRNMNEHELGEFFLPHKVCSTRVLRDPNGNGRGVGFARFESRDICEMVIRDYNNKAITNKQGEEHVIQIRYSDTQEQKVLKQQTAAARQFRAAEFEYGVLQARGGQLNASESLLGLSASEQDAANEFETFLANSTK